MAEADLSESVKTNKKYGINKLEAWNLFIGTKDPPKAYLSETTVLPQALAVVLANHLTTPACRCLSHSAASVPGLALW